MNIPKPTYQELEERLVAAEAIVEVLRRHEVDAVVGEEKITVLLLREIQNAFVASDASFRAMFALPGIGMIQAESPGFRFSRVNGKFSEMIGYSVSELVFKTYIELTHPDDRERDMTALAGVIRGYTNIWSIEKRCVRKDGSSIAVKVNGVVLRNDAGQAMRILAMHD